MFEARTQNESSLKVFGFSGLRSNAALFISHTESLHVHTASETATLPEPMSEYCQDLT
jgi:hypothetical protein